MMTATAGRRTLAVRATAWMSRARFSPCGNSRITTRRSPTATAILGTIAIPMPRATRLTIVDSPSNSDRTAGATPAAPSSLSTACRDGSPTGAASHGSSRSARRSTTSSVAARCARGTISTSSSLIK